MIGSGICEMALLLTISMKVIIEKVGNKVNIKNTKLKLNANT